MNRTGSVLFVGHAVFIDSRFRMRFWSTVFQDMACSQDIFQQETAQNGVYAYILQYQQKVFKKYNHDTF